MGNVYTNLKLDGVRPGYNGGRPHYVTHPLDNPSKEILIDAIEMNDILLYSKVENGIIYGKFEADDGPYALFTGGVLYFIEEMRSKVLNVKKPLKGFEVGKLYHAKNSNKAGKYIYLYLGNDYYFDLVFDKHFDKYYINPEISKGDCFLEIPLDGDTPNLVNKKMALEVEESDMSIIDQDVIENAKSKLGDIIAFGDKDYVEAKRLEIKVANNGHDAYIV